MPSYLSPGIYPREIDFSFYVKQISTSACAMVGIAERGPINEPTLVTSWEQFLTTFGGYLAAGYLAYAARAFFDNGGSVLWVTRIAHASDPTDPATLLAIPASVTLKDRAGTPVNTLTITAASPGAWGRKLSVTVQDSSRNPTTEFTLLVKENSTIVEVYADLSLDETKANYVELVINGMSGNIAVDDAHSATVAPGNRPAVGTFALTGGDDGLTGLTDQDYIGDPAVHTGLYAFDSVEALNLLCVPGVTTPTVIIAGLAYAENRKDLLFLVDAPFGITPQEALDFRKGAGAYSHPAFDSSYGALYYPWLRISDPLTNAVKYIPPTGAVAGCIARSDQKAAVWVAPAGIDRGRVRNVLGLGYVTNRAERDVLYPEGINCIASLPDAGICLWGQKTLQGQASATDRVNVRRLMMHIEKAVAKSSQFVVFEPNLPITWRALIRLVTPFLQDIKDNGGVYDFAVQCDEESNTPAVIDRNELVCRVFVKPTKTAEFVELNFILTATGGDFKELL
ncbi:MAG: phage tail sheath C-terminal domain-containing protein [Armatimonadota bacterium]